MILFAPWSFPPMLPTQAYIEIADEVRRQAMEAICDRPLLKNVGGTG